MSAAGAARPAARIAMWSGPRTVSTALMRAWENRPDTVVIDEPLYAFYLGRTGLDHPGRDEVIASQPTDWRVVLARLASAPLPPGVSISYAKHMTHHLLPEVDRAALAPLRHAHLIRDPRELLASYARVRTEPTWTTWACASRRRSSRRSAGRSSTPVTCSPTRRGSCAPCAGPWTCRSTAGCCPGPPGRGTATGCGRPTGTAACSASTGFAAYRPPAEPLPARLEPLAERCLPYFQRLHQYRISVNQGVADAADLR